MTVVELGKAWFTLKDISYLSQLERAAVITALLPSGQPKWAKELSGNELAPYYLLYALIKEPVELVERIGQSVNDDYDKNGLTYYIGTTIADVLMGVGVSKALKTAKAGTAADDVVKLADNVVDITDDAMKVLDDVIPYADEAIDTLDDIAQYPDEVIDNLDEALDAVDEAAEVAGKGGTDAVNNGATRAAKYSSEWGDASLQEAIDKFAPNVEPVVTSKGKIIYNNPKTGISVVYDKKGNYFRIEDTTRPRGRNYLDMDGNDMNNEVVNGKTRGRSKADYQRVTHFNNSDK